MVKDNKILLKSLGPQFEKQMLSGDFNNEMELVIQLSAGNMEHISSIDQLRNESGEIIVHLLQISRFFEYFDLQQITQKWGRIVNFGFLKWSQSMLRTNVWIRLVEINPVALIRDLQTGVFRFARWNMDFMVSSERKELADFLKPGRSFVMRGAYGSDTQVTGMLQLAKVLSQWTIKGGAAGASGASGGRQGGAGEAVEDGVVVVSGGMGDEREVEGDGAGDRRAAKAAPSGTSPIQ